jgi:hypothetical protein
MEETKSLGNSDDPKVVICEIKIGSSVHCVQRNIEADDYHR